MSSSKNLLTNEQVNQFHLQGYIIIETGLNEKVINKTIEDVAPFLGDERQLTDRVPYVDFNRIQDAWHISHNVYKVATNRTVLSILEQLYQHKPKPFQTLNFLRGTGQPVHSDSIHFNSEPFGLMCGVWTAFEDVGLDQGPLIYYAGSHKLAEMNYPDFGLEASASSYDQYLAKLQEIIAENNFEADYGVLKKGQALIWSANLLHGGSDLVNLESTRKSQVTHYYFEGAKPWRPSESTKRRYYFEPDWVKDMRYRKPKYPLSTKARLTHRIVDRFFNRYGLNWFSNKQKKR